MKNKTFFLIPLFGLVNESFWRGIFGPFFAFIFPLIFIMILGGMLGYDSVLGGALSISPVAVSLASMPQIIFEFKNSSLLKRIGATPIKPSYFILTIICYYFIIMFISIVWCILFSMLFFGVQYWNIGKKPFTSELDNIRSLSFQQVLNNVNWGGFIYSQIIGILVGSSIGMFLLSVAKSTVMIQSISITIMITSMFLSVQVLPLFLAKNSAALWYIGYILSPFKGSTSMIIESWNGITVQVNDNPIGNVFVQSQDYLIPNIKIADVFNMNSIYYYYNNNANLFEVFKPIEKWFLIFLPFFWIILFGGLSLWKFKWTTR